MKPLSTALRSAALAAFILSSIFLVESFLTDFVFSNCLSVGSAQMSCINHADFLYPLVGNVNHGYLLGPLANSDGMGKVAGVSFIGMLASWFYVKRSWLQCLILANIAFDSFVVSMVYFLPAALVYSWRITNYLPYVSYVEGFMFLVSALVFSLIFRLILTISRLRSSVDQR